MTRTANPFALFLIFLLLVVLAFMAMAPAMPNSSQILASAHAVMAHGQAAINAQSCFNGAGQVMGQNYIEPRSGRHMSFCNQNGHWFVSIDGPDGGNVTMFPRSMAKCLRDVLDYAIRTGFLPPQ